MAEEADLDTLEADETVQVNAELELFGMDLLYRCQFKNGEGFYFALLFEHKSGPDKFVAIQIGLYIMLALQKQVSNKQYPLRPVIPVLFYTGEKEWVPKSLPELFKDNPNYDIFKKYLPDFQVSYKDVARMEEQELLEVNTLYLRSAMIIMAMRYKKELIFFFGYF